MARAKVVICSRKLEEIKETAKRISNNDQVVLGVEADVSLLEDRQRLVKEAIEWAGRIDILVNNAGGNPANKGTRRGDFHYASLTGPNRHQSRTITLGGRGTFNT